MLLHLREFQLEFTLEEHQPLRFPLSAFCNLVEIPSPEALTDWRSVLDTVVLGASWAQMGIPGGVMFCIKNKKSSKLF